MPLGTSDINCSQAYTREEIKASTINKAICDVAISLFFELGNIIPTEDNSIRGPMVREQSKRD